MAELRYLLTAERIVLLYSPSGAGKSSLVQAGLLPAMEKRFELWGTTRVNTQPPGGVKNRYVWSAIAGLSAADAHTDMTLADYAASRTSTRHPLVVFDQFEEILRVEPDASAERRAFFSQLGEWLLPEPARHPPIWALFVLREEYLAPLEPYMDVVPSGMRHRYRLDRLTTECAREAIEGPTRDLPRKYAAGVVDTLVSNLATVQVQGPDGQPVSRVGEHVEPLQLQVVCFDMWERIERDQPAKVLIEPGDLGDVSGALRRYYEQAIGTTLKFADTDDDERAIRDWFQDALITADGMRDQVRHQAGRSSGLGEHTIQHLLDAHIVRAEPRGGSLWYELAHDRLIEPVRTSNREWLEAHLNWFQKLVLLWVLQKRPASRLLLGEELDEAKQIASGQPSLTVEEQEFLKQSGEAHTRAEGEKKALVRERKLSARNRSLGIAAGILALVALVFLAATFVAWRAAQEARASAETARASAETNLKSTLRVLMKQVAGSDVGLIASALTELQRMEAKHEDILQEVTAERVQENDWVAAIVSALYRLEQDGRGANRAWIDSMRTALRNRMVQARGIAGPPSAEDDGRINQRRPIAGGDFVMQQHEVTNGEYCRFVPTRCAVGPGENPVNSSEPVTRISWYDATAYAFWLGGHLPTERQWELAARGPAGRRYPWDQDQKPTCDRAVLLFTPVIARCRGVQVVMRGRDSGATPDGIYDLVGNVWEWCRDLDAPGPRAVARSTPANRTGERVILGGSYETPDSVDFTSYRLAKGEQEDAASLGFRVVF